MNDIKQDDDDSYYYGDCECCDCDATKEFWHQHREKLCPVHPSQPLAYKPQEVAYQQKEPD